MFRLPRPGTSHGRRMSFAACLLFVISAVLALPAQAQEEASWLQLKHTTIYTSLYTHHFNERSDRQNGPEYNNDQNMVGIEFHNPYRWLVGATWFKNSYDEPTWYVYGGYEFLLARPFDNTEFYAKLTGGILHGYDGDESRDAIPVNYNDTGPAILPSVGTRVGPVQADVTLFGTSGLLFTGGVSF